MIYFDHNATAPLLPEARKAWLDATQNFVGNPSSPHRLGARANAALEAAREKLANYLVCDPLDIVWTSGATESNNMVMHHVAWSGAAGNEVWASAIEHPCVLASMRRYLPKRHRLIPVTHAGTIELDWLKEAPKRSPPALVALMAVNNETGVVQPWREALSICREHEVAFFCDAAQWIGKLPMKNLGDCDFVSGCAHKFGGPKGVGFLKCPAKGRTNSLLLGGKQEEGRRAGTENVAGVLSMLAALEVREKSLAADEPQSRLEWRDHFDRALLGNLPGAEIVGAGQTRVWNTVSALMPEAVGQQRWVVKLDKLGFAVSTGSACASGKEEPSHVLAAMGYAPNEVSRVLRFSSGWETTSAEWEALLRGLTEVYSASRPAKAKSGTRGRRHARPGGQRRA